MTNLPTNTPPPPDASERPPLIYPAPLMDAAGAAVGVLAPFL